jgi:Mycothiol maleylpyruvate isomerase N-terminal domain
VIRESVADPRLVARFYQETRERIIALVTGLDDAAWSTAVATCPGWSVRDVVAHLAAVAEDWARGRLTGPPTDEETAAQIARFASCDVAEILATWSAAAAQLDHTGETAEVEPRSATSSFMSTTSAPLSAGPGLGIPRRFGISPTGYSETFARRCRCTWRWKTQSIGADQTTELKYGSALHVSRRCGGGLAVAATPSSRPWTGRATRLLCSITCTFSVRPTSISSSNHSLARQTVRTSRTHR